MAVGSGAVEVALAVGSEKLTHEDRSRSFAAIGTAVDQLQLAELKQWASSGSAGSPLPGHAGRGGGARRLLARDGPAARGAGPGAGLLAGQRAGPPAGRAGSGGTRGRGGLRAGRTGAR